MDPRYSALLELLIFGPSMLFQARGQKVPPFIRGAMLGAGLVTMAFAAYKLLHDEQETQAIENATQ